MHGNPRCSQFNVQLDEPHINWRLISRTSLPICTFILRHHLWPCILFIFTAINHSFSRMIRT